jgi:hypothetical protein
LLQLRQLHAEQRWCELLSQLSPLDLPQLQDPELWFLLAQAQRGLGQPELSWLAFSQALSLDPSSPGLRLEAVAALLDGAQWSAALALLDHADGHGLQQWPAARLARARCQAQLADPALAEAQLLALQAEGLVDPLALGVALVECNLRLGDQAIAAHCLQQLQAMAPDLEQGLLLQLELLAAVNPSDGEAQLQALLQRWPGRRRLQLRAAQWLQQQRLVPQAEQLYRQAIEQHGCSGELASAFLALLVDQGRLDDLRQCLALTQPPLAAAEQRLLEAEALCNSHHDHKAEPLLIALLADAAAAPRAQALLASIFRRQGRQQEALALRRQLLLQLPGCADTSFRLAEQLLGMGLWREAWPLYEARFHSSQAQLITPAGIAPLRSEEPPHGRRLLVFGEQGMGDTVMMASMLADLESVAAELTLLVQPRLAPLLQHSFPGIKVRSSCSQEQFAAMDACYGIGSLGRFFRPTPQSCPGSAYLKLPPGDLQHWRQQLMALGPGAKVGIAWRGGGMVAQAQRRSLALEALLPLLRLPGIEWLNLQYGHDPAELESLAQQQGVVIHHFPGITEDLSATTALTAALDLVITVQQTALHLAGAVGTPAWVLLPLGPEWRYGLQGSRMPWYASVELFRQARSGQWDEPIAAIGGRLRQWLAQHNGPTAGSDRQHQPPHHVDRP